MSVADPAPCLACGGTLQRKIRGYRTDSPAGEALFGAAALFRCAACGFVQMDPVPSQEDLGNYYATNYRTGGRHGSEVANVQDFPRDNLFYMYRGQSIVKLLEPHIARRIGREDLRILDVGAGFGHILHAFSVRYPASKRFAVEISQVCVQHLTSLGVTVFQAPTEEVLSRTTEKFDVIVLSHVLEHLREPHAALSLLRERLAPNGVLYIEVPHIPDEAFSHCLDHPWAPRFDEPHLTFFTPTTLTTMLAARGLSVTFCEAAGPEYATLSPISYHRPKLQPLLLRMLPASVKAFLRKQSFTKPLQRFDREPDFYRYGGKGIWIRAVSGKQ
jgi:SAM-dependent methyltransferase